MTSGHGVLTTDVQATEVQTAEVQATDVQATEVQTADVLTALDAARRGALRLLARLPEPPSALRVRAGGVDIALEWPEGAPEPGAAAPPAADPSAADDDAGGPERHEVRAPTVGIFRASGGGNGDTANGAADRPLVAAGDTVEPGQLLAVVSQLGLAVPVRADAAGTVVQALRTDGEPVQHDDPLFVVDVGRAPPAPRGHR
jgi:acetyl-CoA carboxylase biotin carboxyl carrier protein